MNLSVFVKNNKVVLLSVLAGVVVACFYWLNYGIYWGTYPLSSECWVNCIYGGLIGGFISTMFRD